MTKKVSKGEADFKAVPGSPEVSIKRRWESQKRSEAIAKLLQGVERLTPDELYSRLQTYNKEMSTIPHLWEQPEIPSLFKNISTPAKTRVSPEVHGNWLNSAKSFAGFMHPTLETRAGMLKALLTNGITRHVQLANPFVVWLKHPETGPVFPMSSETFSKLKQEKSRTVATEAGPITITYGEIQEDASRNKVGRFTLSGTLDGREVSRELEWPLDTLALGDDLHIELKSSGDRDTYVYKDKSGKTLHKLEVGQIQWDDFQPTTLLELHESATWLSEAEKASAACRAGVGRTGTLFVACAMREWVKNHPHEPLTKEHLLSIIAEARQNRDPQIVQTKEQLALLVAYMNYLNNSPDLPFADSLRRLEHMPEAGKHSAHRVGKYFRDEGIADLLNKECKTLEEQQAREATLEAFFSEHACCPITGQNFVDPVISNTGYTYERSAITNWLSNPRNVCPMSRNKIFSLEPDIFMQRLMSVLYKRAIESIPKTEEARKTYEALQGQLIDEPLHWCRVLSTVMPKNSYFIRKKSVGGANEFVIEFRGKDKVLKQSFHINAQGKFQPEGQSGLSFNTLEELVQALSVSEGKKHVAGDTPPQRLTPEKIQELNAIMGKEAFLVNRFADATLMTIIKHFEMRFVDSEQIGKKTAIGRAGYVRAGQSPASFPCFTYRRLRSNGREIRHRLGIVNGQVCNVTPLQFKANSKEECLAKIEENPNLSAEQKAAYIAELEKIADQIEYPEVILFIPTNEPVDKKAFTLATLEEKVVVHAKASGYVVAM